MAESPLLAAPGLILGNGSIVDESLQDLRAKSLAVVHHQIKRPFELDRFTYPFQCITVEPEPRCDLHRSLQRRTSLRIDVFPTLKYLRW